MPSRSPTPETADTRAALATDDALSDLAAAGDAWPLAAAAHARVLSDPSDEFARVALALAALTLGVPELASDALAGVTSPDADGLRSEAKASPSSMVPCEDAIATTRGSLDAMTSPCRELEQHFERWADRVRQGEIGLFKTSDRNTLTRLGVGAAAWTPPRNAQQDAVSADLGFPPISTSTTANDLPGMLVFAGMSTPWLLARVLESLRKSPDNYTPRVFVVSDSPDDVLTALAARPLAVLLSASSVHWFVGTGAAQRFEDDLTAQWRWSLPTDALSNGNDQLDTLVTKAISTARAAQQSRYRDLSDRVAPRAARDRSYWTERFANARSGGEPLRVLLPVTRYSTYLRHAAHDLRSAIERAGHRAMVLEEPSPDLKPSALFELETHAEFDPDLTLVANWPRATRPNAWPPGSPAVCWVQDMLGTMLDRSIAAQQSDFDFMIGVVNGSLIRDWGFRADRTSFLPTPACPQKFHSAPVSNADAERFTCDVAYVSRQGGSPDRLAERMLERAQSEPERQLLREVRAHVEEIVLSADRPQLFERVFTSVTRAVNEIVSETIGDAGNADRVLLTFAIPLAERAHRHRTIEWAQRACAEQGLTLALFGDGWEHSPFAQHARGPLMHDEELRACYHTAGCHLHASVSTNAHQRVAECALSGGLMLRRGPSPDVFTILHAARERLAHSPPNASRPGLDGYLLPDTIERLAPNATEHDVLRLNAVIGRTMPGLFEHDTGQRRAEWFVLDQHREDAKWMPSVSLEHFPDWADDYTDWTLFSSPEELGSRLRDLANDRDLRNTITEHHRARALAYNTTDAFWASLLRIVSEGIATP